MNKGRYYIWVCSIFFYEIEAVEIHVFEVNGHKLEINDIMKFRLHVTQNDNSKN